MKIYEVSEPIVRNYIQLLEGKIITIDEVPEKHREEISNILGMEKITELGTEMELSKKIEEMSTMCEALIVKGIDVQTTHGIRRFSLTVNDQNDIKSCFDMALKTKSDAFIYHADNLVYETYTKADIVALYATMQKHIMYHKTYFNTLKSMLKDMTSVEEVRAVEYGVKLPKPYLTQMNALLKQYNTSFDEYLKSLGVTISK